MPLVSVVIPSYNSAQYLPKTIASILAQDFDDFEIIIVDDKSTDNTKEVISGLVAENIHYYCLEKNHGGPSLARKIGIEKSRGVFIALCDSDDLFLPNRLRTAVTFLLKCPELGMVFTDEQKFDDRTGRVLGNFLDGYDIFHALPKKEVGKNCFVITPDNAFSCLFYENYIMPSGVTIRREIFKEIGTFDESLTNGDDRDMWFRVTRKYPIGFIDTIGFQYLVRASSISGRGPGLAKNRSRVLQKQQESGLPGKLHNRCQKMIAQNYFGIGYHFQIQGQMHQARGYYYQSLHTSFNKAAFKGVIISLLGTKMYFGLKKVKKRLTE